MTQPDPGNEPSATDLWAAKPQILRSERDFIAIYKPPGLSFHATENDAGTLQILRQMEEAGEIEAGERLYPVHRLDKVTSGILLFARGRKNANLLGNAFRHQRVEKVYLAISDRKPKKSQGAVVGDMEKGRGGAWILLRSREKPAITHFFSYPLSGSRPGLRLFIVRPRTGRTHQIRAALKSLAAPVLGDPLYSRYDLAREEERCYLHAWAIRFTLGEKSYTIFSPPREGAEFMQPHFAIECKRIGDPFALPWPRASTKESKAAEEPTRGKKSSRSKGRATLLLAALSAALLFTPPSTKAVAVANPLQSSERWGELLLRDQRLRLLTLEPFDQGRLWQMRASSSPLEISRFVENNNRHPARLHEESLAFELAGTLREGRESGLNDALFLHSSFEIPGREHLLLRPENEISFTGIPLRLSLWIESHNYLHEATLLFTSANGRRVELSLGPLNWNGWRRIEIDGRGELFRSRLHRPGARHRLDAIRIDSVKEANRGNFNLKLDNLMLLVYHHESDYPGAEISDEWGK